MALLQGPWRDSQATSSSSSSQIGALASAPSPVRRQLSSITCRYESLLRHVRHPTLIPCCGDNSIVCIENVTGKFGKFLPHALCSAEITSRYSIAIDVGLRSRVCPHMVKFDSPHIVSPQECSQNSRAILTDTVQDYSVQVIPITSQLPYLIQQTLHRHAFGDTHGSLLYFRVRGPYGRPVWLNYQAATFQRPGTRLGLLFENGVGIGRGSFHPSEGLIPRQCHSRSIVQ
jgi:hypothetical protein